MGTILTFLDNICVRSKRLSSPFALIALSLIAGSVPAQGNWVSNGGFETGDTAFWNLVNPSPFDFVCLQFTPVGAATCLSNSGSYAMAFGNAGEVTSLVQTISTVAGNQYDLSFFLANDNPDGLNTETFDVFWNGVSVFSLGSPQPSFAYSQQVFLNLTATGTSTRIEFLARHDPSQWFLDNVSVIDAANVPEPGSLLLFATGIALLYAVARARKAKLHTSLR